MEDPIGQYRSFTKKAAIICIAVLILSLVPLLAIGRYDYPSADDYTYGLLTSRAWAATHSAAHVFGSALQQARSTYLGWQGTYSAVFLMALQPAAFGEGFYWIAPVLLILSLTAATLFFLKVFLVNVMGADFYEYALLSAVILFLTVQFAYSPVEGFFWYNGGIYYTFFYSLGLVFLGLVLLLLQCRHIPARAACLLSASILGAVVSGGNYTTALTTVLLSGLLAAGLAARKNRKSAAAGFLFLVTAAFLILSMKAPGNAVRQASVGEPAAAVKAIVLSFLYGAYSICNATTAPVLLAWIFLLPFLYRIARNSRFDFKHPAAFVVLSFCVYCAQCTPPFYAIGVSLPERLIDIIYYSYYLLILADLLYLAGWVSRKKNADAEISGFLNRVKRFRKQIACMIAVLFVLAAAGMCSVSKGADGSPVFRRLPAGVGAAQSLLNGEAASYGRQMEQRMLEYRDPSQKKAEVPELTAEPYVLYESDITPDETDWKNRAVARFYGKESVKLEQNKTDGNGK